MSASPQALAAVRAAKNERRWGVYATYRYLTKRGVTFQMYMAATSFESRRKS